LDEGEEGYTRESFYKLLCDSHEFFASQLEVVIWGFWCIRCCCACRYSRHSIGIMASKSRTCCGMFDDSTEQRSSGLFNVWVFRYAILGDLSLLEKMSIRSMRDTLLLSKSHFAVLTVFCMQYAIFQRLAEDRIFNQIPSILITAKGYIDIATRFILHRLSRAFPHFPIFSLVDWNPAWLDILGTFKFGSIGMGLEAYKYDCNVKWLGSPGNDLQLIPEESYVPLKPRDLQIAKSLMSCDMLQVNKKFMHPLGFIAYFKRRPCRC
ncbi:hypothetical protein MKX03_037101, partial [Papaver bracteatum]